MQQIEVDGRLIAFERAGAGPALVFLHGGLADHREWDRQLELADEYCVVAWDTPGCGASPDPPASFRMQDYADTLAGFIESLGLGRAHIVGLSFGAALALELYRRAPHLPRTLVLASAYAGWAGSLPAADVAERLADGLRTLEQSPGCLAESLLPSLVADGASPEVVERVAATMSGIHPEGARTMLQAMAGCDLNDVLPTIAVPTLLLHGERDMRAPLYVAEELHAAIPGASLAVLPGVGHQCNIEAPESFTLAVRGFLRGVAAR